MEWANKEVAEAKNPSIAGTVSNIRNGTCGWVSKSTLTNYP